MIISQATTQAQPSSLCVLQRSEAPCTSNFCCFHVDGLANIVFCAYAVDGGTIVVQQASESTIGIRMM